MRRGRAVTLIELLVTISLLGVVILAINNAAIFFYSVKTGVLDKQEPFIQGQLAIATMVERGLRACAPALTGAFTIAPDGKAVTFLISTPTSHTERMWLDESDTNNKKIKYCDDWKATAGSCGDPAVTPKVILSDVAGLNFSKNFPVTPVPTLLIIEIDLVSGERLRTGVRARNDFTPRQVIN